MEGTIDKIQALKSENDDLRVRLDEAEAFLGAIRSGEIEALVIGDQVYMLESAEAASNRFRGNVLEQINDIVIAVDTEDRLIYLNPPAERKYGVKASDVLGDKLEKLYTVRWPHEGEEASSSQAIEANGSWRGENVHVTRDGTEFCAESMIGKLHDADRKYTGKMAVIRDVSGRKQAEEELRTAHSELEQRVRERTRELDETIDALHREMDERSKLEKQRGELLERIVTSGEEERGRIARDIHDQLGQRVTALRLQIASLMSNSSVSEECSEQMASLRNTALRLDSEISFLAWELRPAALDDLGLPDAARAFLKDWSHNYKILSAFNLQGFGQERLESHVETQLYRIMQEALNNIAKHSEATRVNVTLSRTKEEVLLLVEDDGRGFDVAEMHNPRPSGKGFGLMSMHERAHLAGGTLEIESTKNKGTTVYVQLSISRLESPVPINK